MASTTPVPLSNPRTLVTISSEGELATPPSGQGDRKQTVCALAFIGSTRAGKSTLINALLGGEDARVAQPDQDGATTAGIRAFDWHWRGQRPPPKPKRRGRSPVRSPRTNDTISNAPNSSFPSDSSTTLSVAPLGAAKTQADGRRSLSEAVLAEQAKVTYSAPTRKALLLDTEGTDAARFIPPAEAHPTLGHVEPRLRKAAVDKRNVTVERQLPRLAFVASNVLVLVTTKDLSCFSCFDWIQKVARSAVAKINRPDRPALVIVQNKAVDVEASVPGDDGKRRAEQFFDRHDQDRDMLVLFSELRVFVLPARQSIDQAFERAVACLGDALWQLGMHPAQPAIMLSEPHWLRVFRSLVMSASDGKNSKSMSFLDAMLAEQGESLSLAAASKVYTTVRDASFNALYMATLSARDTNDGPASAQLSRRQLVAETIAFLETELIIASAHSAGVVLVASDGTRRRAELLPPLEVYIRETFQCQAVHPDYDACHFCRKICKAHGDTHEFSMSQLSKEERKRLKAGKLFFSMRKKLCWKATDSRGAVGPKVDLKLAEGVSKILELGGNTDPVATIVTTMAASLSMCKEKLQSVGIRFVQGDALLDMDSFIRGEGDAVGALRRNLKRLVNNAGNSQ
jgi:hypothetical protein